MRSTSKIDTSTLLISQIAPSNVQASTDGRVADDHPDLERAFGKGANLTQEASGALICCPPSTEDLAFNEPDDVTHEGIALPDYDHAITPPKHDHTICSEGTSPGSGDQKHRQTYLAPPKWRLVKGRGSADHHFDLDNWLKHSSTARETDHEPFAPVLRSADPSNIMSFANVNHHMPQTSPDTTTTNQSPLMGSRLEFDLKHSARNARYNALQGDRKSIGFPDDAHLVLDDIENIGPSEDVACDFKFTSPRSLSENSRTDREIRSQTPSPEQHEPLEMLFSSPVGGLDLNKSPLPCISSAFGAPKSPRTVLAGMNKANTNQTTTFQHIRKPSSTRLASGSTLGSTVRSSSLPEDEGRADECAIHRRTQLTGRPSRSWHRAFRRKSEHFNNIVYTD